VRIQRTCDGKRRFSADMSLVSVGESRKGSPLLIKQRSNLIVDDKQQRFRR